MEELKQVEQLIKDFLIENCIVINESLGENRETYNFYANTCHVCNSLDHIEKRLKRCSGCWMISYCGNSHQAKHWPAHKQICKVVQEIISKSGGPSIFGKTKGMDQTTWTKTKTNAMLIVTLKLGRMLYLNEQKMFHFPRACAVCHESDPSALINCNSCGNSSFCRDHISDSEHKSLCPLFLSSYRFDLLKTLTDKVPIDSIVFALLNSDAMDFIPSSDKIIKSPSCMRKFLDIYFKKAVNLNRKTYRSQYWDVFISECFTRPLTLISVLEKINFKPTSDLIVHVLGASNPEISSLLVWETILHWLPEVQRFKIVLIGPALKEAKIAFMKKHNVEKQCCDRCRLKKKIFQFEIHDTFYHHYMENTNLYSKPNLVIGYNIGIAEFENPGLAEDTWKLTILSLAKNDLPFIFTAYTEKEAIEGHKRMRLILGSTTNYSCFKKNQFASLRPFRDAETEGIFYENNYMILYEKLLKDQSGKDKMSPVLKLVKLNSEAKEDLNKKENKINSTIMEKNNSSKSNCSSEENKKLLVPSEKKKIVSSKEKKVVTSIPTKKNKPPKPTSAENQKASTAVSVEKKKVNSTPNISDTTVEALKTENKLLKERVGRLQTAIEEENKRVKITTERRDLIREVANIEKTIQREIQKLKDEIQNVKI